MMNDLNKRQVPLELSPDNFRKTGHRLVDDIADFLSSLPQGKVNPGETPEGVRQILGQHSLPVAGTDAQVLMKEATNLLLDHSLFNGHPSFFGYITSSAAPIGALGDLLAATVNSNVSSFQLAPMATEIEAQTIRWIAEMIGYPTDCGGLLVSGGNMANFVCFLAGRRAKTPWDIRKNGMNMPSGKRLRVYTSSETHTWIQKAADLFGLGTDSIRWIPVDNQLRMDISALRKQIDEDRAKGDIPLMVIGTAGSVGAGAIDPLREISDICRAYDLWFHVDGAYGALAATLPELANEFSGMQLADSVAVDPHKWLYAPLEAGCVLVREKKKLHDAFSYHASYYRFGSDAGEPPVNFYEYGPQNSRGFRALKVWLGLRQSGRDGYRQMISDDIALARVLYDVISKNPEIQVFTNGLSITTFRFVPKDLNNGNSTTEPYLNTINEEILKRLQNSGEAYVSNAVIRGSFVLRACIVNFRTTLKEIHALPELAVRIGRTVDKEMRKDFSLAGA
jgi:glutamate/tyrosine decarboxylase-like PLP-dependent enzyme